MPSSGLLRVGHIYFGEFQSRYRKAMKPVSLNSRPFEQTLIRLVTTDRYFSSRQITEPDALPNWVPVSSDTWLFGGPLLANHLVDIVIEALTDEPHSCGS